MKNKYVLAVGTIVAGGVLCGWANAQMLNSAQPKPAQAVQTAQPEIKQAIGANNLPVQKNQQMSAAQRAALDQQKGNDVSPFTYGTSDFAEKAGAGEQHDMVKVYTKRKGEDKELILLYMKDFSVYKSPAGQTRCSMTFAVTTTLPTKLSNISYHLKWSNMDTVLSFNNVMPQVENHYNYSLLGDGCYSMDRAPNIVINRCRVKGMSQQVCASKVRWITRAM